MRREGVATHAAGNGHLYTIENQAPRFRLSCLAKIQQPTSGRLFVLITGNKDRVAFVARQLRRVECAWPPLEHARATDDHRRWSPKNQLAVFWPLNRMRRSVGRKERISLPLNQPSQGCTTTFGVRLIDTTDSTNEPVYPNRHI